MVLEMGITEKGRYGLSRGKFLLNVVHLGLNRGFLETLIVIQVVEVLIEMTIDHRLLNQKSTILNQ
jgi:hypothetical protein